MENNNFNEPLSELLQEDRISKLPDDLLEKILSMLTFKEAAQTSILSHRWEILRLYKLPELPNLRRLVLISSGWFKSIIGLTSFIESCPNLEEFALILHPRGRHTYQMSYRDQKPANEESVKSLKVFEFYGYHGKYEYEDELMMFLIEKGVALEKIVIDPRQIHVDHGDDVIEDERTKESRSLAVEKYTSLVPKHVEFVVL